MNSFCSKNPALVILSLGGITLALYVLIGRFSPHVLNQWENTENIIRLMSHFRVEGKNIEEKYQTQAGMSLVVSTTYVFVIQKFAGNLRLPEPKLSSMLSKC